MDIRTLPKSATTFIIRNFSPRASSSESTSCRLQLESVHLEAHRLRSMPKLVSAFVQSYLALLCLVLLAVLGTEPRTWSVLSTCLTHFKRPTFPSGEVLSEDFFSDPLVTGFLFTLDSTEAGQPLHHLLSALSEKVTSSGLKGGHLQH